MKLLTITKRTNRSGSISYSVDEGVNPVDKKRHRKFFTTRKEAEDYATKFRQNKKRLGNLAFQLNPRQGIEAAEAFEKLGAIGATLPEAVEFFMRHAKPKNGKRSSKDVAAELLESKRRSEKKVSYQKSLKWAFARFNATFGEKLVHEIRREEIEDWLNAQGFTGITRRNYLRELGILFRFAITRGYCAENIVKGIEKPAVKDKPPAIFTVAGAARLLFGAQMMQTARNRKGQMTNANLVPYLAIGFFAGLRSSELAKLDWNEINLLKRTIEVTAEKAKTARRRIVEISDNLAAWLGPHEKMSGPITCPRWRDCLRTLADCAGPDDNGIKWARNGLRHSFASYHLAMHQSADKTALLLGHMNATMLFKHYREIVYRESAQQFWNLRPTKSWMFTLPKIQEHTPAKAPAAGKVIPFSREELVAAVREAMAEPRQA